MSPLQGPRGLPRSAGRRRTALRRGAWLARALLAEVSVRCASASAGLPFGALSPEPGTATGTAFEYDASLLEPALPAPSSMPLLLTKDSDTTVELLTAWIDLVLSSGTRFGNYAFAFLCQKLIDKTKAKWRDALPLPLVCTSRLRWPPGLSEARVGCGIRVLNLAGAGLNFLFGGRRSLLVPGSCTHLHAEVYGCLLLKFLAGLATLDSAQVDIVSTNAFARLVGRGEWAAAPDLKADAVDLLDCCGSLNPFPALSEDAAKVVGSPDLPFPNGVKDVKRGCLFRAGARAEYLKLLARQLAAKKVALMIKPVASASTFVVQKRGGDRQREVWHGGPLSTAATAPPKPPLLANPGALAELESSLDRPLWMSARDGEVFFDQLALPPAIVPYMGRPAVRLDELRPFFSDEELTAFILDGEIDEGSAEVTPVNLTWAMGSSWSSFVAQSYMVTCCLEAGFAESSFLTEEGSLTCSSDSALSVATDDVIHFLRASPLEVEQFVVPPLAVLDEVWRKRGLRGHPSKKVDLQPSGVALGIEFQEGVRLAPKATRLWGLLLASIDLTENPCATPLEIASFGGCLQWLNLMNRPLFSCLSAYYNFAQRPGEIVVQNVDADTISELLHNLALWPLWIVDLTRPWLPVLPATDASPVFGFGFCLARCDPLLTRQVAGHAKGDDHIRLRRRADDVPEVPRLGKVLRLSLSQADFPPVFSTRAKKGGHAGELEAVAVVLALKRLSRRRGLHSHRGAFLIDAQAVAAALQKGRSSSGTLRHPVMQAGALTLACDWRWRFAYLPSESNPADWPSRGKRYLKATSRRPKRLLRSSIDRLVRQRSHAVRGLARTAEVESMLADSFFDDVTLESSYGSAQPSSASW